MNLLNAYLAKPSTRKALSKKPGQDGFSLIELVVVIAVLAVARAAFTEVAPAATDET